MSDQERAESLAKALVLECCPDSFPASRSQPSVAFGASEIVGSFDWSKLLEALKVILPVIINLLTSNSNPTPNPKPPFPV